MSHALVIYNPSLLVLTVCCGVYRVTTQFCPSICNASSPGCLPAENSSPSCRKHFIHVECSTLGHHFFNISSPFRCWPCLISWYVIQEEKGARQKKATPDTHLAFQTRTQQRILSQISHQIMTESLWPSFCFLLLLTVVVMVLGAELLSTRLWQQHHHHNHHQHRYYCQPPQLFRINRDKSDNAVSVESGRRRRMEKYWRK